ncbi:MAG: SDR family NAD(P)-dependent oxidoreductase [Actinomycetia bacterium]|nr:SDR family NAD(P)-dependent oxidoreductase [Actinomycetes bacterium]
MELRFRGRTAIVTGAGSGFGRATALGLAREGAAAVCLVELDAQRLAAVASDVESLGARPVSIEAELAETDVCEHAVERALGGVERIDLLVANHAAMSWPEPFLELTDESWERQVRINLMSIFVIAQRVARSMAQDGKGGVILFTTSVNAMGAGAEFAPYCATKAALVALAQVMAVELAPNGIRVNCVSPGPADTQRSLDLVGDEAMERFRASFPAVPMNRLAAADDIAEAFLYLASDAAGYVTGQNLIVDGGLTAQAYHVPD